MDTPTSSEEAFEIVPGNQLVEDATTYRLQNATSKLRKATETPYDLERFKMKLKSEFADSLDYSLLEDQVMPEFCDSSPDLEAKHKRIFSTGISALLQDLTLAEAPRWQDEISDESFVRTEKMVESIEQTPERSVNNTEEFVSFDNSKTQTETPEKSDNACETDSSSDTLKFNDTIEEMEHFLKHGKMEQFKTVTNTNVAENDRFVTPVLNLKPSVLCKTEPIHKRVTESNTANDRLKSNTAYRTDLNSPFRVLTKSNPTLNKLKPPDINKNVYGRFCATDSRFNLRSINTDKFQNIASPIRCYIKNSPTVPLLQNASPKKNYWDRVQSKNPYQNTNLLKKIIGKENLQLPETAYKSSKLTNMVEKTTVKQLPKHHNQVVSIAQNLPKPLVIKHVKREKLCNLLVKKDYTPQQIIDKIPSRNQDSFAHLPNISMDISHCVGKQAIRTRTLK